MMCVCHHAGKRRFLRWKTPFSPQENAVFTVVNAFGESFDVTTKSFDVTTDSCCHPLSAAAPLPFGEGLGVGLVELCCHLPPCCHHRYISEPQWFRRAGGRVAANSVKKFFRAVRLTAEKRLVSTHRGYSDFPNTLCRAY